MSMHNTDDKQQGEDSAESEQAGRETVSERGYVCCANNYRQMKANSTNVITRSCQVHSIIYFSCRIHWIHKWIHI